MDSLTTEAVAWKHPVRILTPLTLAVCAGAIFVGGVGASPAIAASHPKACGFLSRYFTDVSARDTSCRTALGVARRYMSEALSSHPRFPRSELGFRCRRINTGHAGGGWVAHCHRGRATVYMTPT